MRIHNDRVVEHTYNIRDFTRPGSLLEEYAKLAEIYPPLTKDAEWELACWASEGDEEAKLLLFKHNATRLHRFADKLGSDDIVTYGDGSPLTFRTRPSREEVLCWAAQGLWWAIEHFDPSKSPPGGFTSFANGVIQNFIWRHRAQRDKKNRRYNLACAYMAAKLALDVEEEASRDAIMRQLALDRFDALCQRALTKREYQQLLNLMEGDNGLTKKEQEKFVKKVTAKLKAATSEQEWETLKRLLL